MQGVPLYLARQGVIVVMPCACALALFMAVKACILNSGIVSAEIMDFCRSYEQYVIKGFLFNSSTSSFAEMLGQNMKGVMGQMLHCNSNTALLSGVCAVVVQLRIYMQQNARMREKIKQFAVYALTLGTPLVIYSVFLNEMTRAYLFLPMLEASVCSLALKDVRLPKWGIAIMAVCLSLTCIKAAHRVSRYAAEQRARFEPWDLSHHLQYRDAQRYAISHGMDPKKARVMLVEVFPVQSTPDFYAKYPLYPNFHMATGKDKEKHAEILEQMPTWPAEGSIVESQGEIIIKGE